MKAINRILVTVTILMFTVVSSATFADSPKTVKEPDRHSVEVKGKLSMYRVQIQDMGLGEGTNASNAEVFVSIDSNPGKVYTLKIDAKSPPSNRVIADTLRDAYINKVPVTLYHQMAIKRDNNFKIHMVQLD